MKPRRAQRLNATQAEAYTRLHTILANPPRRGLVARLRAFLGLR